MGMLSFFDWAARLPGMGRKVLSAQDLLAHSGKIGSTRIAQKQMGGLVRIAAGPFTLLIFLHNQPQIPLDDGQIQGGLAIFGPQMPQPSTNIQAGSNSKLPSARWLK